MKSGFLANFGYRCRILEVKKKENHQNFAGNPFLRVRKCNGAWVTRPERPKGAKDEVKEARRATD